MTLDIPTKNLLLDPEKRRAWIVYQVSLTGGSLARVAEDAGVNRQTLYGVFQRPYPRMEKLIADALGLTPQALFPDRYNADGLPNRRRGRKPKNSTSKVVNHNSRSKSRNADKAREEHADAVVLKAG